MKRIHKKIVKHPPFKEGSRRHVIYLTSNGRRCSEPNCEVNYEKTTTDFLKEKENA